MANQILYNDKVYDIVTREDNFALCGEPEMGYSCKFFTYNYNEDYSRTPFCTLFKKQQKDGADIIYASSNGPEEVEDYYMFRLKECIECERNRLNKYLEGSKDERAN
jgi:hypothetical protein